MFKYAAVFICCCLSALPGRAQEGLDSLYTALNNHPHTDTVRLKLLNAVAFALYNVDPDSGVVVADAAIAMARLLKDDEKLAMALRNKGLNFYGGGKDTQALDLYGQALTLERRLDNQRGIAKTLHLMGMAYNSQSDYDKAIGCHVPAMAIFRTLKDDAGIANSANSLGTNYMFLGDYPKAISFYQEALPVYEKNGNLNGQGMVYTNIAIVYRRMGKPEVALVFHRKALECYAQVGNLVGKGNVLSNMANVYDDMDSVAQALDCYRQALVVNEGAHNVKGMASVDLNMGILYSGQGDYGQAFPLLQKGQALYETLGDKNSQAVALSELGRACLHAPVLVLQRAGVSPGRRFAVALDYELRALRLAEGIGAVDNQRDVWGYLSDVYTAQGDPVKALDAYKHAVVMKDSLLNDETQQKITRLSMQYAHDKQEAALTADFERHQMVASAALSRQQLVTRVVMGGVLLLVAAGVISFVFYKRKRDAQLGQQVAERKVEVAEVEMKALRSQLNPHFIFNSLNSISDYIARNDTEAANTYLVRFASLMRLILENAEHKEVPLSEDVHAMTLYMDLEALRLGGKFRYRIAVSEGVDAERTFIPPLLLQPFVENSIWHGVAKKAGNDGFIGIDIFREGEVLHCVVEDNGVGREAGMSGASGQRSFGMKITTDRVAMIGRVVPFEASIVVTDLAQGTRVEVKLPFVEW